MHIGIGLGSNTSCHIVKSHEWRNSGHLNFMKSVRIILSSFLCNPLLCLWLYDYGHLCFDIICLRVCPWIEI